jgi:hypothetical protein
MKPPQAVTLLLFLAGAVSLHADLRTSANYSIATETTDVAGNHATSANYSSDGSAGRITGLQTASGETSKNGYIAQLTELSSFGVTATPNNIPQGTTSQLSGTATNDDGTTTALSGSAIAWNSVAYPYQSLSNAGLLTAVANVYSNPAGSVSGTYLGATGFATVTVTGPYSSSVIPDSWFVQYFGPAPNPLADPNADADHTGQTNLFKYIAGLNPIDGSRFTLAIQNVSGQPAQKQLMFLPIVSGRTYTPQFATGLANSPSWQTVASFTQSDNGSTRTVTDLGASPPEFYRIQISFP